MAALQLRPVLVLAHRYVGLATALFLLVAGLTGAVLAFMKELDEALNPHAYQVETRGAPLGPDALAAIVSKTDPRVSVVYMGLERRPGRAGLVVAEGRDPATGLEVDIPATWFNMDPISGEILAQRRWGECCFGRLQIVPFLYELHHNLMLPGLIGVFVMGGVAIFWVFDCFFGLALTFPRGRPFFAKWKPAFTIKGGSSFRLNLDLHRAFGLWVWLLLLAVAISSVAMNLRREVFEPVVSIFSKVTESPIDARGVPSETRIEPNLTFDPILDMAEKEAARRGWTLPATEIFYSEGIGLYGVGFGDENDPFNNPWLYFDGKTGAYSGDVVPGTGTAGDIFIQLQYPIHGGRIAGLFRRIVIAVTGVLIAVLSVTGVVVWWVKFSGRRARARKATLAAGAGAAR